MSIVKYTNKKTGVVSWYESTSHYDPETKQSRPIRKYLGREDPATGELIPSSGQRGRKKDDSTGTDNGVGACSRETAMNALRTRYENKIAALEAVVSEQKSTIRQLEAEKASVVKKLSALLNDLSD